MIPDDDALTEEIRRAAARSIEAPGRTAGPLPKETPRPGENFVVVFRHGESEDNRNRVFSGWRDPPLTEAGREQARALAPKLGPLPLDMVITSDQARSTETARLGLAHHPDIKWEEDARIKERNYGDLTGQSKVAWMKKDPERSTLWRRGYDVAPPNGESLKMVEQRVWPFLDELVRRIRAERINVALSAHGNSMRVIRRYFEHMDVAEELTHENPLGTDYALYVVRDATGPDLGTAPLDQVFAALQVRREVGLTGALVESRRREHGYNEIPEQHRHPVLAFLGKFWGLSAWMLELILILSWLLHRHADFAIVAGLLCVNAVVSFVQEGRAAGVVEALRHRLAVTARVRRDGAWQLLPARELVPGDVVRLRAGDFVPADARLFEGGLGVDESALTGESVAAERAVGGRLYSGSLVRRGEATAVVISTGARTYFGRTTELVRLARPRLHIEEVVARVVRWLFLIVALLLAVVLVVAAVRHVGILEILPLVLVLLLSAVPVALPVMFTVATSVGSLELAKQHVLVTRLSAAEDAAVMDVLCVDKTGTITMNRLAVGDIIPLEGVTPDDVVFYGALASEEANQDPIDVAILAAARQAVVLARRPAAAPISFVPFAPETRRTEAVVELEGRRIRVVKGAVGAVAQACGLDDASAGALEQRVAEAASKGYRALAVASGPTNAAPRPLGLVTLYDPPRPDARALVAALRELGVAVKMLTGDALPIASEIARSVGLATVRRVAELKRLFGETTAGAAELARGTDGFAEVYPEDKYVIVKSLQAAGHVVGMTGDGVNDAPALRQAEVGIAVSNATDVAKGAASVVLTEEGLPGIVALIQQSRAVYQRVLTWIINKISRTILKAAFVAIAFLVTGRFVVSALGMILLVFTSDFAKIALATDNVRWSKQPETWDLAGPVQLAVLLGVLLVLEALGLLAVGWRAFGLAANPAALNTFTFQALLYLGMFSILSIRERRRFWASRASRTLLGAVGFEASVATLVPVLGISGFPRLPWTETVFVFGYTMVFALFVNDFVKAAWVKRGTPGSTPRTPVNG